MLLALGACASNKKELKNEEELLVQCEVKNIYGVIGCGKVPVSAIEDLSYKYKEKCPQPLNNKYSLKDISCLEENRNSPIEAYRLGNLKVFGESIEKDIKGGMELIEYSSKNKYPEAMTWLAKVYESQGEYSKGFSLIKEAADLGNPLAMYSLGFHYNRGIGVEENKDLALFWLNKSKKYIPAAYSEMAIIHFDKGDVASFITLNEEAISRKYWFSYVDLAILALGEASGYESYKDLNKANVYAEELIKNNVPVGYFIKAKILESQSNNSQICEYYKKAFINGYFPAGISLAHEYLNGINCDKNYNEALKILKNLYESGSDEEKIQAAHSLGYAYMNGLGVERNNDEAKRYLLISAKAGHEPSQELLNKIEVAFD